MYTYTMYTCNNVYKLAGAGWDGLGRIGSVTLLLSFPREWWALVYVFNSFPTT